MFNQNTSQRNLWPGYLLYMFLQVSDSTLPAVGLYEERQRRILYVHLFLSNSCTLSGLRNKICLGKLHNLCYLLKQLTS